MERAKSEERYYFRFTLGQRYLHGLLMATFLGLAGTGMALRFSYTDWASSFAHAIGGFVVILFFHKVCAVLLTTVFVIHVSHVLYRGFVKRETGVFWGPNSMVPQPRDIADFLRQLRWFFWLGPKPEFDRHTYWEKFDYWAVFWGMAIIGISGYMMWFAPFFARLVPGYVMNIALLVHGEEALLAVWFIFLIHFFNSHLRPSKFPADLVIFTGRVAEEEVKRERPREYRRWVKEHGSKTIPADPPPRWLRNFAALIAVTAVSIGFVILGLTLMAFFKL